MNQQKVKIIGLELKERFGILNACQMEFDEQNKLVVIKGSTGSGKSTLQKSLKLGTQGSETLKYDKSLYGKINQEIQLKDGDIPVFVGCKSNKSGNLIYTIYTKDENGKIVHDPVIDGVKATPASYLKSLQTELTWRANELTSESAVVQRDILLKIYQRELTEKGVIFDQNDPNYEGSILHQLEQAIGERTAKDVDRKKVGGFSSHLKDQGYDVENPDTLPTAIDEEAINKKISKLEFNNENIEQSAKSQREGELLNLKEQGLELNGKIAEYNRDIEGDNKSAKKNYDEAKEYYDTVNDSIQEILKHFEILQLQGLEGIGEIKNIIDKAKKPDSPTEPIYKKIIPVNEKGQYAFEEAIDFDDPKGKDLINQVIQLRKKAGELKSKEISFDTSENDTKIQALQQELKQAKEINKIVAAVDSFYEWQDADRKVQGLNDKYRKLLASVETGVEGLIIVHEDDDIFLKYDGSYDPKYFGNAKKEMRKVSSYSGTQKPMIALLVQTHLLKQKEKAMRYLWIDDIPIDSKTRGLLEQMGANLDVTIFVNITGDFDKDSVKDGEVLIEGGEIFFTGSGIVTKQVEQEKEETVTEKPEIETKPEQAVTEPEKKDPFPNKENISDPQKKGKTSEGFDFDF